MWTSNLKRPDRGADGSPRFTRSHLQPASSAEPRCLPLVRVRKQLPTWRLVAPILAGLFLMGCGGAGPSESETPEPATEPAPAEAASPEPTNVGDIFPEGLGRQLVLDTCGACHAIACSAIGQRMAARWNNLKEDHRDKVPSLSEEELETLFAYLNEHFSDSKPEPRVPPHFLEGGCTPF